MKNIDVVRNLFEDGTVKQATNEKILSLTGIKPHQQIFQLTQKLVNQGYLKRTKKNGREWIFYRSGQPAPKQNSSIPIKKTTIQKSQVVNNLSLIEKIGFENIGDWQLFEGKIDYSLSKYENARQIMYTFVLNEEVLYLGKTTMSLKRRMYGYKKPGPTQSTNIKNNKRIKDLLEKNNSVEIWVFKPKDEWKFNGVPVNLAAGLEDNLISIIKPLWNSTGK